MFSVNSRNDIEKNVEILPKNIRLKEFLCHGMLLLILKYLRKIDRALSFILNQLKKIAQ
jgi:hypothetical protein